MIEQKDVIAFFDERAGEWDAGMVRSDEKIGRILDNAKVTAGSRVLDIACGTGVLIGDYLRRNVESVTAVDISPEMIRIAREKFPQENVRFVCGDAETAPLGEGFDSIVIYNAFPHFPDPERLVARLAALLGIQKLWVKDDGINPTASLKDRASAMAVATTARRAVSPTGSWRPKRSRRSSRGTFA